MSIKENGGAWDGNVSPLDFQRVYPEEPSRIRIETARYVQSCRQTQALERIGSILMDLLDLARHRA